MIIEDKIGLRAIEKEDVPLLHRWRNDESLRRYFREYRELSLTQKHQWYDKMIQSPNFEMFMIDDVEKKESVGITGFTYIDWVNRHSDVHFYIGKNSEWIDSYYAPIAIKKVLDHGFNMLNMNKLWAEIYEIDEKKLSFFQNHGFTTDATLRDHYYYEGQYYTSYIVSLLKKDYE